MKEKIRPIYYELQGYLSQAPKEKNVIFENSVWEHYNTKIDELSSISGEDYSSYKVNPIKWGDGLAVEILNYRTKLGGLIARLHGKFFPDESPPFSGMPSTIITQTQQQTQSFQIQMLLEIQSKIDEKTSQFNEGSKERRFLDKIKNSLSSVKDTSQLITLILKVGKEIGLTLGQILDIFK